MRPSYMGPGFVIYLVGVAVVWSVLLIHKSSWSLWVWAGVGLAVWAALCGWGDGLWRAHQQRKADHAAFFEFERQMSDHGYGDE